MAAVAVAAPLAEQEMFLVRLTEPLAVAEPAQRKSILRGFIKNVTVNLPNVAIEYQLPLPTQAPADVTCIDGSTKVV
jgi:hypothetical protein